MVKPLPSAVIPLDHRHRRATVIRYRLQVFSGPDELGDEGVAGAVEFSMAGRQFWQGHLPVVFCPLFRHGLAAFTDEKILKSKLHRRKDRVEAWNPLFPHD